jgi:hypothetical protein
MTAIANAISRARSHSSAYGSQAKAARPRSTCQSLHGANAMSGGVTPSERYLPQAARPPDRDSFSMGTD